MHTEILTEKQTALLPSVSAFAKKFGLVGGTAIALHLGHRQSIDFDLFTSAKFKNAEIRRKLQKFGHVQQAIRDEDGQYDLLFDGVHFTFFYYPFPIEFIESFKNIVKLPDLLTLAAMKAYALGRRAKWKDYIDLYFIAKKFKGIEKINKKAKQIFGGEFNEKIFREQLSYFADIDYSEQIDFMPGFAVKDAQIKKALVEFSLN